MVVLGVGETNAHVDDAAVEDGIEDEPDVVEDLVGEVGIPVVGLGVVWVGDQGDESEESLCNAET